MMFRMNCPMTSPAPEDPIASATISTPASIQIMSWVISFDASFASMQPVKIRMMTPAAGARYIQFFVTWLKMRQSITTVNTMYTIICLDCGSFSTTAPFFSFVVSTS